MSGSLDWRTSKKHRKMWDKVDEFFPIEKPPKVFHNQLTTKQKYPEQSDLFLEFIKSAKQLVNPDQIKSIFDQSNLDYRLNTIADIFKYFNDFGEVKQTTIRTLAFYYHSSISPKELLILRERKFDELNPKKQSPSSRFLKSPKRDSYLAKIFKILNQHKPRELPKYSLVLKIAEYLKQYNMKIRLFDLVNYFLTEEFLEENFKVNFDQINFYSYQPNQ